MADQRDTLARIVSVAKKLPGAVADGIAHMVKTPGALMKPNPYPPGSEEADFYEAMKLRTASEWGPEMAMGMMGTGVPMAKTGAVGTFGGKLAKTADLGKLEEAKRMLATANGPNEIRARTGWFQGSDGQWRFEIPDEASRWKSHPQDAQRVFDSDPAAKMGQTFEHSPLYEAYPQLAQADLNVQRLGNNIRGSYQSGGQGSPPTISLAPGHASSMRSTALHELQHGIQDIENFATGGNTFGLKPGTPGWQIYQERLQAIRTPATEESLRAQGVLGDGYTYADYLKQHKDSIKSQGPMLDRAAQDYAMQEGYRRLAGETEARNVQARADFTPEQRAGQSPSMTQDVPTKDQFVKFRGSSVYILP